MSGPASTTSPTRRRSFASSGLSYEQVARELGLLLCAGLEACHWSGQLTQPSKAAHERGVVTGRVIHWSRERMTRRGLFEFLKLASHWTDPASTVQQERWLALYYTDWVARRLARKFRVRIPAEYGKREKARVRLDLAHLGPLDTEFPEQRQLIRRVQAWSR